MTLHRTEALLSTDPDDADPRGLLVEVLHAALELLSIEGNDFAWSSWKDQRQAVEEVAALLSALEAGALPERLHVAVLFAPTGPIQEVSISSGWGETFLKVAERYDYAERLLWPQHSGRSA
jgi:hypothetical protein